MSRDRWHGWGFILPPAAFVLLGVIAKVAIGFPVNEEHVDTLLPIAGEEHHNDWGAPLRFRYPIGEVRQTSYDTFTFNVDGHTETANVSPDMAAKYNPGDRVEVTYTRNTYKDGRIWDTDFKVVSK